MQPWSHFPQNLDVLLPTITNIINTSLASGLVLPDFKNSYCQTPAQKTLPQPKCTEKLPSNLNPTISV